MTPESLLSEIRAFCEANADPALVAKYAYYFKKGYDAYGVGREKFEEYSKSLVKAYKDQLGFDAFLKLGDSLVKSPKYEEGSFAIVFAIAFKKQYKPETLTRFGSWLDDGLRNWAHVDYISSKVLPHFINDKIVTLNAFSDWRNAESKWKRRAVPVTMIDVMKQGYPIPDLLAFIDPMMLYQEKVIQQGLGWFLRECWKKQPDLVEAFLLKHKEACGRIIVQYATEKMTKEQRGRFKRI
ncbi:MAG: DNA alkylation repair protein [bacterium]|nr:DNA alkylation repair protein [bacterium]